MIETELVGAGCFPQEVGVEILGQRFGLGHHLGRRRRGKAQQDVGCLDLAALARGGFHLRRGVGFGQDGTGLEMAVLFKDQVHENQKSRMVWKWRSNPAKPWSPPSSMICVAPA